MPRPHREELERFLDPAALPGHRDRLVYAAHGLGAPDDVVAWLRALPPDQVFFSADDIVATLGGCGATSKAPVARRQR